MDENEQKTPQNLNGSIKIVLEEFDRKELDELCNIFE